MNILTDDTKTNEKNVPALNESNQNLTVTKYPPEDDTKEGNSLDHMHRQKPRHIASDPNHDPNLDKDIDFMLSIHTINVDTNATKATCLSDIRYKSSLIHNI